MSNSILNQLYRFEGYCVDSAEVVGEQALVVLRRDLRHTPRCPRCEHAAAVNRVTGNTARDLPLGPVSSVLIRYPALQLRCSACGSYSTLRPPGIDAAAGATTRLMRAVSWACRHMPLTELRGLFGVSASTARRYDKAVLLAELPTPGLDGLRLLLVDEKAVRRRHGYVTLVMNGETGELLHLAEGKKKASLQSFFDRLGAAQKASVEAVCIDRAGAYQACVRENLPGAEIVYDKFHLVASLGAAIDEVRRAEWRAAEKAGKRAIKGSRFLLLSNRGNLARDRLSELDELLALNANLAKAYVLKDAFKRLWTYVYPKAASNYLHRWCAMARDTGIAALERFAASVLRAHDQIVAFCRHPITTAKLESFNATVARIIRKSCGVRDLDYLFLKLRQESL